MAAASLAQPKKQKSAPDPDLVYRELVHQRQVGGRRGAYGRTGRICDCSDEYVRQIAIKREQIEPSPEAIPLTYLPCPGQTEYERQLATDNALLRQLHATETPTDANEITSTPNSEPLPIDPPLPIDEREPALIVPPPVANVVVVNYGSARPDPHADMLPWLMAMAALTATLCVLLTALAGSVVAVAWVPFPLVLWWIVARLRRAQLIGSG